MKKVTVNTNRSNNSVKNNMNLQEEKKMKNVKLSPNYDAVRNQPFEDFLQSLNDDEDNFYKIIELIGKRTYHYISDPVLNFVKKAIYGHIEYRGKWFDTRIIDEHNEWIIDSIGAANKAISAFEYETDCDGDPTEKWQSEVFIYCHNIEFALFMVYGDIEENIAPFLDYCKMCLDCGEYINLDNYEAISAAFEEADIGYYYSCDFDDGELPDEDTYEDEDYDAISANSNITANNGASTMVKEKNTEEENEMTNNSNNIINIKPGTRIKLIETNDLLTTKLQPGSTGTVTNVSVADGVIAMEWDNGSKNYYLVLGVDKFEIIDDKPSADVISNIKLGARIRLNKMNEVINAEPVPGSVGTVLNVGDDVINVYWDNDARTCLEPGVDEYEIRKTDSHDTRLERGARIKLVKRNNPQPAKVPSGCMGTVINVYDGFIDMKWDNESRICLVPGYDHFEIINNGNEGTNEGALENKKEETTMEKNNSVKENKNEQEEINMNNFDLFSNNRINIICAVKRGNFNFLDWQCTSEIADAMNYKMKTNFGDEVRGFIAVIIKKRFIGKWLSFDNSTLLNVALNIEASFNETLDRFADNPRLLKNLGKCECSEIKEALSAVCDNTTFIEPFMDYCRTCWDSKNHIDITSYEKIREFFRVDDEELSDKEVDI